MNEPESPAFVKTETPAEETPRDPRLGDPLPPPLHEDAVPGPLDDLDPAAAIPAAIPPRSSGGGVFEWLFAKRSLGAARESLGRRDPERTRRLARADKAIAYGDRILDPASPPRSGAAPELALSLYREAFGWLLAARQLDGADDATDVRPDALLGDDIAVRVLSDGLTSDEDALALARWDFPKGAALDEPALRERARLAKRLVHAASGKLHGEERTIARLQLRRISRLTAVLTGLFALLGALALLVMVVRRKPDLGRGRPWRASSSIDTCHPEKRSCTGADTAIFFHTKEDDSPWVEIDLGKGATFSRVEIVNRLDCCSDRAIPMVIEVSNDRQKWKEVATRTDSFRTWSASFAKQSATYIRARVTRKTHLHLEGFSVR